MRTYTPSDVQRLEAFSIRRSSERARSQTMWPAGAEVSVKLEEPGRHHSVHATVVRSRRSKVYDFVMVTVRFDGDGETREVTAERVEKRQ